MTKEVVRFTIPKVPLWARLLGSYRAKKRARVARKTKHLIATILLRGNEALYDKKVISWIHLFETGEGRRSYTYEQGSFARPNDYKQFRAYAEVVIPWLHKKYDNQAIKNFAKSTTDAP